MKDFSSELLQQHCRYDKQRPKRRGTANKRVCQFFTWWWFSLDNRDSCWPQKVVYTYSPSEFRLHNGTHVWLRGEGVQGTEIDRTLFRHLGRFLERFAWFRKWNRRRCECGETKQTTTHVDRIEGTTCELYTVCAKCGSPGYEFLYGNQAHFCSTPWEDLELAIFGTPAIRAGDSPVRPPLTPTART